ncbi:hypothetical protein Tco_0760190 [Tanacetum coccineum]
MDVVMKELEETLKIQNCCILHDSLSGICLPGPDGEMYYGQLEQILEFSYLSFKTVLFRVKWFDTSNKGRKGNPKTQFGFQEKQCQDASTPSKNSLVSPLGGVAVALPFLAPNAIGAKGGGRGKDWDKLQFDLSSPQESESAMATNHADENLRLTHQTRTSSHISEVDWDAQIAFWNDPKNLARAAQNKKKRGKEQGRMPTGIPMETQLLDSNRFADPIPLLEHILMRHVEVLSKSAGITTSTIRVSSTNRQRIMDHLFARTISGGHIPDVGFPICLTPSLSPHSRVRVQREWRVRGDSIHRDDAYDVRDEGGGR